MRFVLYHPWVYLTGGAERVLLELMRHSRHDWVLVTHHHDPGATFAEFGDLEVVTLSPGVSVERRVGPVLRAARTIASTSLPDVGADALLVSSEGLGDLVVAGTELPAAVYCHTPLKIRHCTATRRELWRRSPVHWAAAQTLGLPFDLASRRMWSRYRHRFANSEETRRRVARAGLASAAEVEVLRPGVDTTAFRDVGLRFPDRLLVAGRIMWQKNIELAIDAFRDARTPGAELVVAGAVDDKSRPYLARLRERAVDLPVRFVVDPDDATLQALYASATATVFTPPNEDFGIVPLESMASGTPVLGCDSGGVRESVVDGVTGWLAPSTVDAFATRMRRILVDGVDPTMRLAAEARAAQFGWDAFAARIDDVMASLATAGPVPARGDAVAVA